MNEMKLFKHISEFNDYLGVDQPNRTSIDIGIYNNDKLRTSSQPVTTDFYRISIKYDFHNEEEIKELNPEFLPNAFIFFSSPNQVFAWEVEKMWSGYYIQIEKSIIHTNKHLFYNFLEYGYHEGLFLTAEEEKQISVIFKQLYQSYLTNKFPDEILFSYCHLIFTYIDHFYQRQFQTRKEKHNSYVSRFQLLLKEYYSKQLQSESGIPSVKYFAELLHITPGYFGEVIRSVTGFSPIEHIQKQIIVEAKLLLKKDNLSNSEIAYKLGFEYPNYFSKMFKKVSGISPTEYRKQ